MLQYTAIFYSTITAMSTLYLLTGLFWFLSQFIDDITNDVAEFNRTHDSMKNSGKFKEFLYKIMMDFSHVKQLSSIEY